MAAIDRSAHLGREVSGIDDVLDADRDATQRPGRLRTRPWIMADEGPDRIVLCADRLQRLADGGIRQQRALLDTRLKVGK